MCEPLCVCSCWCDLPCLLAFAVCVCVCVLCVGGWVFFSSSGMIVVGLSRRRASKSADE